MADGLHVPCNFDGQLGGGVGLRDFPHKPVSKGRGKGGTLGPGVWGGGAVAPKPTCYDQDSPSPLAHTVDGEEPWCPSLRPYPCSLPGLGSLSPRQWPEAPAGSVTPADAPTPQDCGLRHIQNRARGTDVPILWLWSSFLE